MAWLVYAGMEGWAWRLTHSDDPVAVAFGQAIAERVVEIRADITGKRHAGLAKNIGVAVGNALGRVLKG